MKLLEKIINRFDIENRNRNLLKKYIKIKKANSLRKQILYVKLKRRGLFIAKTAQISEDVYFVHPNNIYIGFDAVIGAKTHIYQNVIIGAKDQAYPKIGSNCIIYANSTLIGDITIADNIVVGAGSIVNKSFTTPNVTIAGNPAKIIKENKVE